ncbi:DUF58 domain-containing protein [Mangrovicella endophytica]|uniref:DUF58 domain-containing protein n=1 Tax=Mangrovicella endophytica TaxID=2066697 RepID=UPI000C9E0F9E|nr:DUF58 domain-containing protein [Mangrovicella endophytica]
MSQSTSAAGIDVDADALFRLRHYLHRRDAGPLPTGARPGSFAGRRRGNGIEIVDVRLFSEGDDIRHVDAATTARTGKTHVRTYRDERERTTLLLADLRPSMLWGTRRRLRSVAAAEALALAGWQASEAGGRTGLLTISADEPVFVAPRARDRGMADVAGGLARAHRQALAAAAAGALADAPLTGALEQALDLAPTGSTLVLATGLDSPGSDFDDILAAIRQRFTLLVLLIRDAFERDRPTGSYPFALLSGPARWARLQPSARGSVPDPRLERLQGLGIAARFVDADAEPERLAEAVGGLHVTG